MVTIGMVTIGMVTIGMVTICIIAICMIAICMIAICMIAICMIAICMIAICMIAICMITVGMFTILGDLSQFTMKHVLIQFLREMELMGREIQSGQGIGWLSFTKKCQIGIQSKESGDFCCPTDRDGKASNSVDPAPKIGPIIPFV
jgi:hypothetical protein